MQLNTVAYDEGHDAKLKKELFLGDAISDLPPVIVIFFFCVCQIPVVILAYMVWFYR